MNAQSNALTNNCCIDNDSSHGMTRVTASLLTRAIEFFAQRQHQRTDRKALKSLLTLDDAMLKDIGVSRGDVQWASNLPLSTTATTELEILARRATRSNHH